MGPCNSAVRHPHILLLASPCDLLATVWVEKVNVYGAVVTLQFTLTVWCKPSCFSNGWLSTGGCVAGALRCRAGRCLSGGHTPCALQVEPTLINITPQLIDVSPKGVVAEAAGIAIENSLINIAPGGRSDSFHP